MAAMYLQQRASVTDITDATALFPHHGPSKGLRLQSPGNRYRYMYLLAAIPVLQNSYETATWIVVRQDVLHSTARHADFWHVELRLDIATAVILLSST